MRTGTLVVVAALAAAAAGIAAAAAATPTRAACTPGQFTKGGSSGVAFCGPAKAIAKVGSRVYSFDGGSCIRTSKYFNLNLGTEVLSGPQQKYSYFAILVGAYPGALPGTKAASKDGTYGGGLVTVRWRGGKAYVLNGAGDRNVKVTLKKGRTAGTFSGTTFLEPHVKVTGSFSC